MSFSSEMVALWLTTVPSPRDAEVQQKWAGAVSLIAGVWGLTLLESQKIILAE